MSERKVLFFVLSTCVYMARVRSCAGFLADLGHTRAYQQMFGLVAFFRGHQDEECSFKVLKHHEPWVVSWTHLLGDHVTRHALAHTGVPLARFLQPDTAPVFTLSSAAEARGSTARV